MSQKLSREGYEKLIDEDIAWLQRVAERTDRGMIVSLEGRHIVDVLRASIDLLYPPKENQ